MMIRNVICLFFSILIASCSMPKTKEFFLGDRQGPNPFVIGSILKPLKNEDTIFPRIEFALPQPKAINSASRMISRAQKADKILGIKIKNKDISYEGPLKLSKTQKVTMRVDKQSALQKNKANVHKNNMNSKINSLINGNEIDFYAFDKDMIKIYNKQSKKFTLASYILGENTSIDPTISDYIQE